MTDTPQEPAVRAGFARGTLFALGLALALLGAVGAFLPILPTTPFVLLAAACFARSSPRFHERLRENRFVGPYLCQWQREHTVPRAAKRKAYGLLLLSFSLSIWWVDATWLRWTLAGVGAALVTFLACLPTAPAAEQAREA